jgi:hypothetical protein
MLHAYRNYVLNSFYVKQIPTEITTRFSVLQKWPDEKFTEENFALPPNPQEVHKKICPEQCELTCAKCFVMYITCHDHSNIRNTSLPVWIAYFVNIVCMFLSVLVFKHAHWWIRPCWNDGSVICTHSHISSAVTCSCILNRSIFLRRPHFNYS